MQLTLQEKTRYSLKGAHRKFFECQLLLVFPLKVESIFMKGQVKFDPTWAVFVGSICCRTIN